MWSHFINGCGVLWEALVKGTEPGRTQSGCCGGLQEGLQMLLLLLTTLLVLQETGQVPPYSPGPV